MPTLQENAEDVAIEILVERLENGERLDRDPSSATNEAAEDVADANNLVLMMEQIDQYGWEIGEFIKIVTFVVNDRYENTDFESEFSLGYLIKELFIYALDTTALDMIDEVVRQDVSA